MTWRAANSLLHLRDQVNAKWPNRKKDSDGLIGDERHSSRESDHNPNPDGVVCAFDITHDPAGGPNAGVLAEIFRAAKDPRIKYVISNKHIFSSTVAPWKWREYHGLNAHEHHIHISVLPDKALYDDVSDWNIG